MEAGGFDLGKLASECWMRIIRLNNATPLSTGEETITNSMRQGPDRGAGVLGTHPRHVVGMDRPKHGQANAMALEKGLARTPFKAKVAGNQQTSSISQVSRWRHPTQCLSSLVPSDCTQGVPAVHQAQ